MTKENVRKRSKQQLGAEALTELKEGRVTPSRPEWSDRRRLGFWQPFNEWWRSELDRLGRRPSKEEIGGWYEVHAYELWKDDAPSLEETRVHAKCLRSIPLVRDYFRNYRARKRAIGERVGANRQRRRGPTDSKLPQDVNWPSMQNLNMAPGEEYDYREEMDEGDEEGDEGEDGQDEDDMSGGRDVQQHESMAADPDGRYPLGLGIDVDGYLGRDPATAAAAAAAGLAHLATLRGASGSSSAANTTAAGGALPLEFLHTGVPAVQSLLSPSAAAALWSAAQHAAVADVVQPGELLPGLTLQQLQQVALQQQLQQHAQQQLALAAIAQNMALSRAAGIAGISGFPRRTAATAALMQPHGALMSAVDADERHLYRDEQFDRLRRSEDMGGGEGGLVEDDDEQDEQEEEDGPGTLDFMEQVAQQAANLGRGKRKRGPGVLGRRQEYEVDELQGGREAAVKEEDGTDTEAQAGPSGRGSSGRSGSRRGGVQQQSIRQRRGSKGLASNGLATGKQNVSRRQSVRTSVATSEAPGEVDAARGQGDREQVGPVDIMPLDMLQVPLALSLDPVPRETLLELTHEELVERVLLLQAHVQLLTQQRQQLEQQLQQQRLGTPLAPAPECRTPPLPLREQQQQQQEQGQEQEREPQGEEEEEEGEPLRSGVRHHLEQGQEQGQEQAELQQPLLKQGEQPTPMPTPVRPDSSPSKAGPTSAALGGGCSPAEMQRCGSPIQGVDSGGQVTTIRLQQPLTRERKSVPLPLRRSIQEQVLQEQVASTAVSVRIGADMAPPAPALLQPEDALVVNAIGNVDVTTMGTGLEVGLGQSRGNGSSGIQSLTKAFPQAAEA